MNSFRPLFLALFVSSVCFTRAQVNTVPEGVLTLPLTHGITSYLSVPVTADPVYSDAVSAVTPTGISVANSSAFTGALAALTQPSSSIPYFVKFLTGAQTGRVLLVTGNSTTSLTLDTTDHSSSAEPLSGNTDSLTSSSGTFNVAVGDTFEVFPGDTLSTVFGNNVTVNGTIPYPLVLTGKAVVSQADTVGLPTTASAPAPTYYFNTTDNYWVQYGAPLVGGVPVNADNTVIYPYSAISVLVRNANPSVSLQMQGRVAEVALLSKATGRNTSYSSTLYPSAVTLSQLALGPSWVMNNSAGRADTLGVYNSTENPPRFDVYYQDTTATWRKYPDTTTSYNTVPIAAGTCLTLLQRSPVSGAAAFLGTTLPYSITQ